MGLPLAQAKPKTTPYPEREVLETKRGVWASLETPHAGPIASKELLVNKLTMKINPGLLDQWVLNHSTKCVNVMLVHGKEWWGHFHGTTWLTKVKPRRGLPRRSHMAHMRPPSSAHLKTKSEEKVSFDHMFSLSSLQSSNALQVKTPSTGQASSEKTMVIGYPRRRHLLLRPTHVQNLNSKHQPYLF